MDGSSSAGASWAAASRAAIAGQGLLLRSDVGLGPGQGRGQPFAFAHGAAQDRVQVSQPLSHRREPRVGFMQPFQGGVRPVLRLGAPGLRGGQRKRFAPVRP